MIGFSDIREESRDRLYDVIAEQNDVKIFVTSYKKAKFNPEDIGDGECARCHCGITRNGGAVEFTIDGLHLKWDHLCLTCAAQIKHHLFHPTGEVYDL